MDRGAWWATVHGVSESRTRLKRHSMHLHACAYVCVHLLTTAQGQILDCPWSPEEEKEAQRPDSKSNGDWI